MTDYHPVTKEELNCKDCINTFCSIMGRNASLQTFCSERMLPEPTDPLALLEAWAIATCDRLDYGYYSETVYVSELQKIIKQLHTNPEAVAKQGIVEGWWK